MASHILFLFALLAVLMSIFPVLFALPQRIVADNSQHFMLKPREFKRQSRNYCGTVLWEALDLVCQGRYNSPSKRSNIDTLFSNDDKWTDMMLRLRSAEPDESDVEYSGQFLAPKNAFAVLGSPKKPVQDISLLYKRGQIGVVDECCKKSCTINELKTYCST